MTSTPDTTRAILFLLSIGGSPESILRQHPTLTRADVQAAAAEALRVMELGESREARITRVRTQHPHAFEPWTPQEDAQLAHEYTAGATIAALGRAFGRPPGSIRMRLQKLGIEVKRVK